MPARRRVVLLLGAGLLATACTAAPAPLPTVPAPTATVVPPISYPADAGSHDVLTEWWYYTGHLRARGAPHEYGFEFTVFQLRRAGAPVVYLAHFAVTDVDGQTFSHQARTVNGAAQSGLALNVQDWQVTSDGTDDAIQAQMEPGPGVVQAYGLDLQLHSEKPPALHNGGYLDYGPQGGSYYYSRTRLSVAGQLRTDQGDWEAVAGQAWMDHQWGNFVIGNGGWDWYSLQLDDDRELMLYVLRDGKGGTIGVYGTAVDPSGATRALAGPDISAVATGSWTSPHTGAVYPSGWHVMVPAEGLDLVIAPKAQDQELYFPGQSALLSSVTTYWEGAVSVAGSASGEGYVELTGYTR
jgi:predicted secreted hydrolase